MRGGFDPYPVNPLLFDWQKLCVRWAVERGRCALFEECGLGKTLQQLEWASQVVCHTGGKVLIVCPLAVAQQTVDEGRRFGYLVNLCRQPEDVKPGINITNIDRVEQFDAIEFDGVVLDESSILKSYNGKTRHQLNRQFARTLFRLCCTATPSPNDFTELGQHADFLGICTPAEMLATYFINDTFDTGTWRLKGHAIEAFWEWVSSWAICLSKPSDLGFSDEGFELPPVETHIVTVPVDHWGAPGSGSDRLEHKEKKLLMFGTGEARVIITKPKIAGFGLNWQHCHQDIYVGLNHSWERFYQGGKRIHRFGQKRTVQRYIIQTDLEDGVLANLTRKQGQHEQMHELTRFTRRNLMENNATLSALNTEIKSESGEDFILYHGDCVRVAKTLETNSIGFSVFSPPFADLFTYSSDIQDMGNCKSMDDFMEQFSFLIYELYRITMPGRECAVHCCDLLATKWKDGAIEFKDFSGTIASAFRERGWLFHSRITIWKSPVTEMQRTKAHGLLYKTLTADSSNSRVGSADYLLVFRKPGKNPVPIEHTDEDLPLSLWQEIASPVWMTVDQSNVLNGKFASEDRDERHICPLQLDVINRALRLWSTRNDIVFSPFTGIGSEGYCALNMFRRFVGAELKESYFDTALTNLKRAVAERDTLFTQRA